MTSRKEIERILRAELDRAVLCEQDASIQYRKILDELAHGSPSSKDIDRLEEAAETELAARSAMWTALVRFTLIHAQLKRLRRDRGRMKPDGDSAVRPRSC